MRYLPSSLCLTCLAVFCVAGVWPVSAFAQEPALSTPADESALDSPQTGTSAQITEQIDPSAALVFERDIRPILKAHCLECHGGTEELKGNLDLRTRRFMLRGGDSGAALVPGDPGASYFLTRIESGDMPPGNSKVSPAEIAKFTDWIKSGAPTARSEPETLDPGLAITPEERAYWAFQPIRRPVLPARVPGDGTRNAIDALLLPGLKELNLGFAPEADKRTLALRAYLDLLGLPPSPEEIARFANDPAPDAYEKLIDELLRSPHYGERFGRHWLDAAGYADSEGATNQDAVRSEAFRYRDYVIRSLNADKPFDQFIVEQLAGDELVPQPYADLSPEDLDRITATGFLRMAADGTGEGPNTPAQQNQVVADTIKIVSTSLLGLSVGCAQCHDHRYDPIPQSDYYSLVAIFDPGFRAGGWRVPSQRRVSLQTDAERQKISELDQQIGGIAGERAEREKVLLAAAFDKELAKYEEAQREQLRAAFQTPDAERSPEQKQLIETNPNLSITPGVLYQYDPQGAEELKKFNEQISTLQTQKPVEQFVRIFGESTAQLPETNLLYRGDPAQPKQAVPPADLTIASAPGDRFVIPADDPNIPTSGRRLAYARWLTSGRHPLLGRVLANRIWMHHFGRALVPTAGDFGFLGERPTHPELLDYLADEFAARGWSLKYLHKLIMTSAAYRQASVPRSVEMMETAAGYYASRPLLRLEAEAVRDRVLAVSSSLDPALFGPPLAVAPDDAGVITESAPATRRSLYLQVRRSQPLPLLTAFDAPVMETNCDRRTSSTVSTQSLLLMNSKFMLEQSAGFAKRVAAEATSKVDPASIPEAYRSLDSAWGASRQWEYGYGSWDAAASQVQFTPLLHFVGNVYQGGPEVPDPSLGWVQLRRHGGHPGNAQHAAIRRWHVDQPGMLRLTGNLVHGQNQGDGVRARLISSRLGQLAEWVAFNQDVPTQVEPFEVQAGDTLDLIVDCQESESYDSFVWTAEASIADASGNLLANIKTPDVYGGPPPQGAAQQVAWAWEVGYLRRPTDVEWQRVAEYLQLQMSSLTASGQTVNAAWDQSLTNLCQAILSSNEFLYVE